MFTMLGRSLALAVLVATLVPAAPLDRTSHSAPIATELAKALSQQKLDAIAAQDPDEPDRFIAALFFENTQLLVVSGRYASPSRRSSTAMCISIYPVHRLPGPTSFSKT
jgi:hypothetical protein